MSLPTGKRLSIRAMVYVASEPIPFFWPMRTFIHHNPLHSLEDLSFEQALQEGKRLFHGRVFLARPLYRQYLQQGKIDVEELHEQVARFVAEHETPAAINLQDWLMTLLTHTEHNVVFQHHIANAADIHACLNNQALPVRDDLTADSLVPYLRHELLGDKPVYEAVDALYGTAIGAELNELVIKSCLDFFDEGQSVWAMPGRKRGFFKAWRDIAKRNIRLYLRGMCIKDILRVDESAEGIIAHVMNTLGINEDRWVLYFTRELAQLHGWTGFIRWRWNAKNYHWSQQHPADLIDLLAIRLTFALALLSERSHKRMATSAPALEDAIVNKPMEMFLRYELFSTRILPAMAHQVEQALALGKATQIERVFHAYLAAKRQHEAQTQARQLLALGAHLKQDAALQSLTADECDVLLNSLRVFEHHEGMYWLRAMESHAITQLLDGIQIPAPEIRQKRPFVQAMFCIDTRSERIRRHLESVGDYETYGIAGFFGVSDLVIGLTIVAIGTSLPELAASLMSALRKEPDLALGNALGSNITNTSLILGVTALVMPLAVPPEIALFDVWVKRETIERHFGAGSGIATLGL